jgi:hypothetical protein
MSEVTTKYSLVICELHNKHIHGFTAESDKNVQGHYLVIETFDQANVNIKKMNKICKKYNRVYGALSVNMLDHPIIRNYPNVVTSNKYIRPQIAERIYLNGDECVAILKTHWIRLIQRNWRRVYNERQRIYDIRKHPRQLHHRQITGTWSKDCLHVPSLRGLLRGL